MKKIVNLMIAAVVASLSASVYAGTPISQSELPQAAQSFVAKYFPGEKVRKAEKEQGRRGLEYEVKLTGGAEIDFRDNGDWKEVKVSKSGAVPSGIVPVAIAKHVTANYPDMAIVEISRKRGGYEVELSNGTELKLTEEAKPLVDQRGQRPNGHGRQH